MTKGEYKKELYNNLIEILDKDIEETEEKQKTARGDLKRGIQIGKRIEAGRIKNMLS